MSYTFKDSKDRDWTISVTVGSARTLEKKTGIHVYSLPQNKFKGLFDLLANPLQLLDFAYALCVEAKDRTQEDLESAIDGPALERLGEAVVEAIPDFFSDPALRVNLRNVFAKSKKLSQRMMARGTAEVEAFDPDAADLDELLKKIQAQQNLTDSSGSGPASPASIQPIAPSGS